MGIYGRSSIYRYSAYGLLVVYCMGFVNNFSVADVATRSGRALPADGADEAALLAACGFEMVPSNDGPFYTDDDGNTGLVQEWRWTRSNPRLPNSRFDDVVNSKYPDFTNAKCELWAQQKWAASQNFESIKDRCESVIAGKLNAGGPSSRGQLRFGSLGGLTSSRSGASEDICRSFDANSEYSFACSYLRYQRELSNEGAQSKASAELLQNCLNVGANMNPRLSRATYQRMTEAGLNINGGVYCGPQAPIVIQNQQSFGTNLLNTITALGKVGIPALTMYHLGKKSLAVNQSVVDHTAALGFVPGTYAGSTGIAAYGMGGYGFGGGFGVGMGGVYGPGGVGGIGGGGMCGVPPYAPWYGGCGAGGGGGIGGGGVWGGGYGGYPYGAGAGGYPYGVGYGTGGVGFPGPFGTINGGNGWGGPGGGFGGGGAGAFPGPFGTINGGNGWGGPGGAMGGNPWGAGGQFGGPSFWGAGNPGNADMLAAQAGYWEQQAARARQQASMAQQAANIYEQTQQDMRDVSKKNQQAYLAYQMALAGYGAGSIPGSGSTAGRPVGSYGGGYGYGTGYGYGSGGGYYGGGSSYYAPTYYPSYQGGAGGGNGNFSLWGSGSYRR